MEEGEWLHLLLLLVVAVPGALKRQRGQPCPSRSPLHLPAECCSLPTAPCNSHSPNLLVDFSWRIKVGSAGAAFVGAACRLAGPAMIEPQSAVIACGCKPASSPTGSLHLRNSPYIRLLTLASARSWRRVSACRARRAPSTRAGWRPKSWRGRGPALLQMYSATVSGACLSAGQVSGVCCCGGWHTVPFTTHDNWR